MPLGIYDNISTSKQHKGYSFPMRCRKWKAIIYKGSTTLKDLYGEKLRIMGGEKEGMHITNPKLK